MPKARESESFQKNGLRQQLNSFFSVLTDMISLTKVSIAIFALAEDKINNKSFVSIYGTDW